MFSVFVSVKYVCLFSIPTGITSCYCCHPMEFITLFMSYIYSMQYLNDLCVQWTLFHCFKFIILKLPRSNEIIKWMLQERKQQKQTSTEFEISCEACVLSKFVILIDIDSGFCYGCKENVNHHNFFLLFSQILWRNIRFRNESIVGVIFIIVKAILCNFI